MASGDRGKDKDLSTPIKRPLERARVPYPFTIDRVLDIANKVAAGRCKGNWDLIQRGWGELDSFVQEALARVLKKYRHLPEPLDYETCDLSSETIQIRLRATETPERSLGALFRAVMNNMVTDLLDQVEGIHFIPIDDHEDSDQHSGPGYREPEDPRNDPTDEIAMKEALTLSFTNMSPDDVLLLLSHHAPLIVEFPSLHQELVSRYAARYNVPRDEARRRIERAVSSPKSDGVRIAHDDLLTLLPGIAAKRKNTDDVSLSRLRKKLKSRPDDSTGPGESDD